MTNFEATIGYQGSKNIVRAVNLDEDFCGVDGSIDPLATAYFGKQANLQLFPSHRLYPNFREVGNSRVIPPKVGIPLFPTQRTNNPIAVSLRFLGQVKPYNSVVWGDEAA